MYSHCQTFFPFSQVTYIFELQKSQEFSQTKWFFNSKSCVVIDLWHSDSAYSVTIFSSCFSKYSTCIGRAWAKDGQLLAIIKSVWLSFLGATSVCPCVNSSSQSDWLIIGPCLDFKVIGSEVIPINEIERSKS